MTTTITAAQYQGLIKRRIKNRPEEDLQKTLVAYLEKHMSFPPLGAFFFHVPNGGKRTKAEAGIFKAMGQRSGVPDLVFVFKGRVLCLELKAPRDHGRPRDEHQLRAMLSDAQEVAQSGLSLAGATIRNADTLETALQHIRDFGIPIKS